MVRLEKTGDDDEPGHEKRQSGHGVLYLSSAFRLASWDNGMKRVVMDTERAGRIHESADMASLINPCINDGFGHFSWRHAWHTPREEGNRTAKHSLPDIVMSTPQHSELANGYASVEEFHHSKYCLVRPF